MQMSNAKGRDVVLTFFGKFILPEMPSQYARRTEIIASAAPRMGSGIFSESATSDTVNAECFNMNFVAEYRSEGEGCDPFLFFAPKSVSVNLNNTDDISIVRCPCEIIRSSILSVRIMKRNIKMTGINTFVKFYSSVFSTGSPSSKL